MNFNTLSEFLREPRELPCNQIWTKIRQNCTDFSCLQEIEEFYAWKVRKLGWRIQICYLNFQGNQGSCHGNQIWTKISQNCTDFSPVQEIDEFYAWKVRILGWRIQICYYNFQGNQGRCHGNQIQKNISQNCTNVCFLQKIDEFFACSVGFMGFVYSNMLPEFSRELRELPWQPNLGKKAKIAQISIPCKKSRNFKQVNTGLLNSNAIWIFHRA